MVREEDLGLPSIDDDLAELREIQRRLPSASLAERVGLRERQRELRTRWPRGFEGWSTTRLEGHEQTLVARRDALLERRLDIGSTGNGSGFGGGLDPLETMLHNRRVDELNGLDDVEQELLTVRAELQRRSS